MTKTLVGTPDPEPNDEAYDDLVKRYRQEREEAVRSVANALYVPLTWISKYKK